MLEINATHQFLKDLKVAKKRGLNITKLNEVVRMIAMQQTLPPKNRDHKLSGDYSGCRECHIQPDWLLVYKVNDTINILSLVRTGSHSDLF